MTAKCSCQHCDEHIAFPAEMAGQMVECPHCHLETRLFIPATTVPLKQSAPVRKNNKLGSAVGLIAVLLLIAIIASVAVYKRRVNELTNPLAGVQLPDIKPKEIKTAMPVPMLTEPEASQKLIDESGQRREDHYNSAAEAAYRRELETKEHFDHLLIMNAIKSGMSDLQLEVMKLNQDEGTRAKEAIHATKEAEWQRKEDEWFKERQKTMRWK